MTTFLELVNRVLFSIGERPLLDFSSSTISDMVVNITKNAMRSVYINSYWSEFFKTNYTSEDWELDILRLPSNVYKVSGVHWCYDGNKENHWTYDIPFVPNEVYNRLPKRPLYRSYKPLMYTLEGRNVVRVNPYPIEDTYSSVGLDLYQYPELPENEQDVIEGVSEELLYLIALRGGSILAMQFLADRNLEQSLDMEFQLQLRKLGLLDKPLPSGGYTLYNNRRRIYG